MHLLFVPGELSDKSDQERDEHHLKSCLFFDTKEVTAEIASHDYKSLNFVLNKALKEIILIFLLPDKHDFLSQDLLFPGSALLFVSKSLIFEWDEEDNSILDFAGKLVSICNFSSMRIKRKTFLRRLS